jgi:hypothetical protein
MTDKELPRWIVSRIKGSEPSKSRSCGRRAPQVPRRRSSNSSYNGSRIYQAVGGSTRLSRPRLPVLMTRSLSASARIRLRDCAKEFFRFEYQPPAFSQ